MVISTLPVVDIAFVLATNEALLLLLGRVVGLGQNVQGRIGSRAWVDITNRLVHCLGGVEQPSLT